MRRGVQTAKAQGTEAQGESAKLGSESKVRETSNRACQKGSRAARDFPSCHCMTCARCMHTGNYDKRRKLNSSNQRRDENQQVELESRCAKDRSRSSSGTAFARCLEHCAYTRVLTRVCSCATARSSVLPRQLSRSRLFAYQ